MPTSFRGTARRRRLVALAALAALIFTSPPLQAARQAEPVERLERLKGLSLEQLMELEVTSATKFPQPLAEIPAAISVISQEDLRRSGVRTLADALRLATGVHVARFDNRTWAVSARGLNAPTANKLLVLIDGRSVYTPLFSGVFWDVQDYLIEDIDRIEVIRGPGAALWGANAVNGVVNVVTEEAAATQGGLAQLGAGTEHRAFGALRWGGELGSGHYRVYGKYQDRDALEFEDGRNAEDPLQIGQGGFRADLPVGTESVLTLQGDAYEGRLDHAVRDTTDVDGANLGVRWRRTFSDTSDVEVRAYYDHTYRDVPGQFEESRSTYDLELQHHWRHGRHELVWGGGYRSSEDRVSDSEVLAWVPGSETIWIANLFVQDEIDLSRDWHLTLGTKLEEQSFMDLEIQPSVRLAWTPETGGMVWAAASRAVRAPTRIDLHVRVPGEPPFLVLGNPEFQPEELIAYELGYRYQPRPDLLLDLATFYNEYDDLRSQEPSATGVPLVLGNRLEAETYGAELSARFDATERLHVQGGLTWLTTDLHLEPGSGDPTGGTAEANDPDLHGFLRVDLDLPGEVELGAWLRYVDDLPFPQVPSYTTLDLRLGWEPLVGLELSLVGQNLLEERHVQFGSPMNREAVERGVYGELLWRF